MVDGKPKRILSPDYFPMLIDRKRNKVLGIMLQICCRLEPILHHELNMHLVEDDFLKFMDELAEKEHNLGWCEDPNCTSKYKKDEGQNTH